MMRIRSIRGEELGLLPASKKAVNANVPREMGSIRRLLRRQAWQNLPTQLLTTTSKISRLGKHWLHLGSGKGLDLLFPPVCLACNLDLPDTAQILLCDACTSAMTQPARPCCPRCGTVSNATAVGARCLACQDRDFRFDALVALGDYQNELRDAVLRTKRAPGEPLAMALSGLLWREHQQRLRGWNIDVVVPIPAHWARRILRGTNSPEIMGSELSRKLAVPRACFLRRRRRTRPQGALAPSRRVKNVRGAFRLQHAGDFQQARVLLIDDVVTSGATCSEAAKVLKRAGAQFVAVAAIARTQPRG